jgi:hypothetical protein
VGANRGTVGDQSHEISGLGVVNKAREARDLATDNHESVFFGSVILRADNGAKPGRVSVAGRWWGDADGIARPVARRRDYEYGRRDGHREQGERFRE